MNQLTTSCGPALNNEEACCSTGCKVSCRLGSDGAPQHSCQAGIFSTVACSGRLQAASAPCNGACCPWIASQGMCISLTCIELQPQLQMLRGMSFLGHCRGNHDHDEPEKRLAKLSVATGRLEGQARNMLQQLLSCMHDMKPTVRCPFLLWQPPQVNNHIHTVAFPEPIIPGAVPQPEMKSMLMPGS